MDADTRPGDRASGPAWRSVVTEAGFVAISLAAIAVTYLASRHSGAPGSTVLIAVATAVAMHVGLAHDRLRAGFHALAAAGVLLVSGASVGLAVIVLATGGLGGAFAAPCATRSCVLRAGAWTAAAAVLARAAVELQASGPAAWTAAADAIALGAGCVVGASAVVAIGPLAEWVFNHATRLTMNERLDYDHPLLRRLMTEAPGTFQHSVNVGMLADAAAQAIDADALVARVGGLYHDVGKIDAPAFFVENQEDANPHDALDPLESVSVLRAHVSGGVALVTAHRLGDRIVDFVREHHGTGLMQVFRAKALALGRDDDEELYRYRGPRPRSRETAIVMIADQLEATARAVQPADDVARREIVRRTLARLEDERQLEDSSLSVKELEAVQDALVRSLQSMHHRRMNYPPAAPSVARRSPFAAVTRVLRRRRAG